MTIRAANTREYLRALSALGEMWQGTYNQDLLSCLRAEVMGRIALYEGSR